MNRTSGRSWDLVSIVILLLALTVSAQRLAATSWASDLQLVPALALLGACLGLPLGSSRLRRSLAWLLALGYSLVIPPFVTAGVLYPGLAWLERLRILAGRLLAAAALLGAGKPVKDTLLFTGLMIVLFWAIGLASTYTFTRSGNVLASVLPAGIALVIVQIDDPVTQTGIGFVGLFFLLALLLIGRRDTHLHRLAWRQQRVFLPEEAGADLNGLLIGSIVVLLTITWLLPSSARPLPALRDLWTNLTRPIGSRDQPLQNLTAGLVQEPPALAEEFYGATLPLGIQAASGTTVEFRVLAPGQNGTAPSYWRVRSYDQYADGVWQLSPAFSLNLQSGAPPLSLPVGQSLTADFVFEAVGANLAVLVTPALPMAVSRPAQLTFFPAGSSQVDPILFQSTTMVLSGDEYSVQAAVQDPTVLQLRAAGTDYPSWVVDHYLQLPPDLPTTIGELAMQVTASDRTPYDQAQAITEYLRQEIHYSASIPPAPQGIDQLSWFLFDQKAGFCSYDATAEVLMLRTLGIPSRLTVGFAQGRMAADGWQEVQALDAHSWPEVYFPGVGWVEFEPTVSQPDIIRPEGMPAPPITPAPAPARVKPRPPNIERVLPGSVESPSAIPVPNVQGILIALFLFLVFLGAALLWAFNSQRVHVLLRGLQAGLPTQVPLKSTRWLTSHALPVPGWLERSAWRAGLSPMQRSFTSIYQALRLLGIPTAPSETPAEASALLSTRLPEAADPVAVLLAEYQASCYGDSAGDLDAVRRAAAVVRRLAFRRALVERLHRRSGSHGRRRTGNPPDHHETERTDWPR
jgi:transglutaminase-like putative cysteine protease